MRIGLKATFGNVLKLDCRPGQLERFLNLLLHRAQHPVDDADLAVMDDWQGLQQNIDLKGVRRVTLHTHVPRLAAACALLMGNICQQ